MAEREWLETYGGRNVMEKKRKRRVVILGIFLCLCAFCMPVSAASKLSRLQVKGSRLVNSNGKNVQLRGVSTHGLSWYPEYVNVDTFRKLRDEFNINTIRLAMYTAEDGGYCVSDDTARQQMLACLTSGIEAAIQLDMYVIVDWHILSDSNPNLYKETALSFFERIASTYGDKPNILYEICNEPNGDT